MVNTKSANETQTKLEARVPAALKQHAHHWLILHGRYVCKARTPECWRCPVVGICQFSQKVGIGYGSSLTKA
ncbi:MAG: hypothetical protein K2Q12_05435 [Rickettsiales bacterium]|nr:hypothetical protein [Rickettsiales bacterium]